MNLIPAFVLLAAAGSAEPPASPEPAQDPQTVQAETPLDAPATALPEVAIDPAILEQAAAIRDAAASETGAYGIVESLAYEVGPRLAGSDGDRAAIAWAMDRFRSLGFRQVTAETVEVPHWVRGEVEVEVTAPFPQAMVATALGGSIGTPEGGIEAPVVAVPDLDALADLSVDAVEGRIVFFHERMERRRDGSGYGEAVKKRADGPAEAAKKGAVGVIIRSVGTSDDRIAHTGGTRYQDDVRRIPAVAISNPDADALEYQIASGVPVTASIRLTSRELPPARSANIIAEIPGRGALADEIVVLAAHLDSWDLGQGAVDDGAGVGIVMEAARLFRDAAPRSHRTVRVVLYANEEFGLSGAKAYVEDHEDELTSHVLAMEADSGAGRVYEVKTGVAADKRPLAAAMIAVLEPLGIGMGDNDSEGGADIGQLFEAGVPVLGPRQDVSEYFDIHHSINDTMERVDPASLDQNVAVYAALTYLAAVLDVEFGRAPEKAGEETDGSVEEDAVEPDGTEGDEGQGTGDEEPPR